MSQARGAGFLDVGPTCITIRGMHPVAAATSTHTVRLRPDNVHWRVASLPPVCPTTGKWNRVFGLLLMDQPVGTGYSYLDPQVGNEGIPRDELGMAAHLYAALQGFFARHAELQPRPLFITGEVGGGYWLCSSRPCGACPQ